MFRSITVARIFGVDVRIHTTFIVFHAWIAVMHLARGGLSGAIKGVVFTTLIFACVLLHEFGHILAARRFGIPTSDVTLLPIGGVARLQRIPERPSEELVVAIAGPLVNVVIAGLLILMLGRQTRMEDIQYIASPGGELLAKLASVNVSLVLFNLIPAFPMDGGRVLRSLLVMAMPYGHATRIAARIGQMLAIVFGVFGLFGNPMLIFIALFIFVGAKQEAAMVHMNESAWSRPHPWRRARY